MEEIEKIFPFIYHTEGEDLDFVYYHNDAKFSQMRDAVREKIYTAKKTDVTYRVLSHWDKNGLLPEGMDEQIGEWRRFTFIERVWLETVKRLRAFGLSLDTIVKVRKRVMRWSAKNQSYMDFEYFVAKARASGMAPYIVVLANGDADVASIKDISNSQEFLGHKDMLLISLKSILQGLGLKTTVAQSLFNLSPAEISLLAKIRLDGNNEVKVRADNEGRITELESTKTITDPPPNHELQKKIKDAGMYGEVVTKYEDGKSRSVRITKKQRFDAKK